MGSAKKTAEDEGTRGADRISVARGVNAVVAVNVNEPHSRTIVSSRRRIVQRSGKTIIDDETREGVSDEQR
jgi:hypothetical protein